MKIDNDLITYLEDLANLSLGDEEKTRLAADMEKTLGYMEKLSELDTTGIPERSHPFDNVNGYREDVIRESYDRELILKNAPKHNDEMIIAPKTVE